MADATSRAPHAKRNAGARRHPGRPWRAGIGLVLVGGVAAATAPSSTAGADLPGASLSNVAVAEATATSPTVVRRAFQVRETFTPAIAPSNLAQATASDCSDCQAVAAALQVVVASRASAIDASNLATATSSGCTSCATAAIADQWIVASPDNRLAITPAGRIALARVHLQLLALTEEATSAAAVAAAAAPLVDEVDGILANDVTVVPPPPSPAHLGWPGRRGPSDPFGARAQRRPPAALEGRSVTVLPERGYTLYVTTKTDVGSDAATAPPSPGTASSSAGAFGS